MRFGFIGVILAFAFLVLFPANQADAAAIYEPSKVIAAVNAPFEVARTRKTASITSATISLLADLPAGQFGNEAITQNVVIKADSANTDKVCIAPVVNPNPKLAATDTCAEVCALAFPAAGDLTCAKTANDGEWLSAGQSVAYRDSGSFCYCGEAGSGTQYYQAIRGAR